MADRPILFSGPMVRAILAGRKTQTRRVVKPQPDPRFTRACEYDFGRWGWTNQEPPAGDWSIRRCPFGEVETHLWVRETWAQIVDEAGAPDHVEYRASGCERCETQPDARRPAGWPDDSDDEERARWHSPIFMPRWASRLTLLVTAVRVERVQSITEEDARAEGMAGPGPGVVLDGPCAGQLGWSAFGVGTFATAVDAYRFGWDVLNGKRGYGWDTNPWVWVVAFTAGAP